MNPIIVSTQAEYDQYKTGTSLDVLDVVPEDFILMDGSTPVIVRGANYLVKAVGALKVTALGNGTVEAYGACRVMAKNQARVEAFDRVYVELHNQASAKAHNFSHIDLQGAGTSAHIYNNSSAEGYGMIEAFDKAKARVWDRGRVLAEDQAEVFATDEAVVSAYDNSIITARGHAHVRAFQKSHVNAEGTVTVQACHTATIIASQTSYVLAYGLVKVQAKDFAIVRCQTDSVTVEQEKGFLGMVYSPKFVAKEDFEVYKALKDNVLATLIIPKGTPFQCQFGEKCRAKRAIVKELTKNGKPVRQAVSMSHKKLLYLTGKEVSVKRYCHKLRECESGIHFFRTKELAADYLKGRLWIKKKLS